MRAPGAVVEVFAPRRQPLGGACALEGAGWSLGRRRWRRKAGAPWGPGPCLHSSGRARTQNLARRRRRHDGHGAFRREFLGKRKMLEIVWVSESEAFCACLRPACVLGGGGGSAGWASVLGPPPAGSRLDEARRATGQRPPGLAGSQPLRGLGGCQRGSSARGGDAEGPPAARIGTKRRMGRETGPGPAGGFGRRAYSAAQTRTPGPRRGRSQLRAAGKRPPQPGGGGSLLPAVLPPHPPLFPREIPCWLGPDLHFLSVSQLGWWVCAQDFASGPVHKAYKS